MESRSNKIIIFTDGGVRNNDRIENIGAWAYTKQEGNETTECYEIVLNTTSDIQEMKACIEALKSVTNYNCPIEIYSDSSYLVNGMNKWIHTWKKNNWNRGKYNLKPLINLEQWKELDRLSSKFSNIRFIKVKGHSNNEGNNRVDKLVKIAMNEYKP